MLSVAITFSTAIYIFVDLIDIADVDYCFASLVVGGYGKEDDSNVMKNKI